MSVANARALGIVKTTRAGRYLDQVISHFGHRGEAERDANRGIVRFPGGTLSAIAGSDALRLEIAADDEAQVTHLKDVVKSHLERWGLRDNLVVEWKAP